MNWVAQYTLEPIFMGQVKTIKIGIKQDNHLVGVYLDIDINLAECYKTTKNEAIQYIVKNWGSVETFEWL